MNYLDYLCGIYEICFKSPKQLNAAAVDKSFPSSLENQSKFYDYTASNNYLGTGTLNIYATSPRSLSHPNKNHKFSRSDWDVIPKSCNGDWVMRYSENETNFNPWQFNAKFSHFELVPWRQQKKNIDLSNAIGWEPFQIAADKQLRTLHKFELARSKRLLKKRLQVEKNRTKRQIKIRFIFALEVRQKKLQKFKQRKMDTRNFMNSERQLCVLNTNCVNMSEHWGYFSQRNKGVEELLFRNVSYMNGTPKQKSIAYGFNARNQQAIECNAKIKTALTPVPCKKCQNRYVAHL